MTGRSFTPGLLLVPGLLLSAGCEGGAEGAGGRWEGSVDTLADGRVVVHNAGAGVWTDGEEWAVTEELRIGSMDGAGPATFGQIRSLEADPGGRIWVVESQAREIRVFDPAGAHVRTIGREGGGPGEFSSPVHIDLAPDGNMWVMDPSNARLSVIDTAGNYMDGRTATGGFIVIPWPGGFDGEGRYHAPVPVMGEEFSIGLGRYDASFTITDTLETPSDPVERDYFSIERDGVTRVMAGIPFQGGLRWRLASDGTFWALVTDQYRLFRIDERGDTLRTITRDFDAPPVTPADRQAAIEGLEWFTGQGGQIEPSKIPATKPPTESFFIDDRDHLWVARVTGDQEAGRRWDVFAPDGRFLGSLELPFTLDSNPQPVARDGLLYGVTRDELEVPYVVRASIVRPVGRETSGGS